MLNIAYWDDIHVHVCAAEVIKYFGTCEVGTVFYLLYGPPRLCFKGHDDLVSFDVRKGHNSPSLFVFAMHGLGDLFKGCVRVDVDSIRLKIEMGGVDRHKMFEV
jgi:hypothetical protein